LYELLAFVFAYLFLSRLRECGPTFLVLTGVTAREAAERFPYRASRIVESVAALADEMS
jgi:hypothetical protein